METYVDIDLSMFYKLPCKLIPGELVELKMIEFYKYYQDDNDNIYNLFTNYLLKLRYGDNVDRNPVDIFHFYRPSYYANVILDFNNKLDCLIILKSNVTNFKNILFDRILTKTDDKLMVRFKIIT